jgi:hypothetical protein
MEISPIRAGLSTAGFLQNGMTSQYAERCAADQGFEAKGLNRFKLSTTPVGGLLIGSAAFLEREIARGWVVLAALEHGSSNRVPDKERSLAPSATRKGSSPSKHSLSQVSSTLVMGGSR